MSFVDSDAAIEVFGKCWDVGNGLAVEFVTDAYLDFVKASENVEFGYDESRVTASSVGVLEGDNVEPTGASRPSCCRTEFVSDLRHVVARALFEREFSWEWAVAYSSTVCLGDAKAFGNVSGMNTSPVAGIRPTDHA